MSRVIPEEGDKGRSEPAPDHHQGPAELSTRRWYPEQPYPSQPDNSMGRIKKWPLPRIIVIDSSHIADFPSHPFIYLVIANLHLPRIPHPTPQRQAHRQSVYRRYVSPPLHDRLIHCPAPSRPGARLHGQLNLGCRRGHLKLLIVLKIVHSAQVLGKRAEKPFFRGMAG